MMELDIYNERDAAVSKAYRKGQEDMRERAAMMFDQDADDMRRENDSFYWQAEDDAKRIRALPITERSDE